MPQTLLHTGTQQLASVLKTIDLDPLTMARIERAIREIDAHPCQGIEPETTIPTSDSPHPNDLWTRRARPTFLYVIYAMLIWAFPIGLIAAYDSKIAGSITKGMTDYLSAIPDTLYALFGSGYLGYAALRQWGKMKGTDH